ncbi:nucleotide exchange factor GrpE [Fulvivirga sp. RKSG066]|uniref:nucleotide exchange factor GrpE n=1 Tax=Fulvivirga aurantia TaxID=2529383 RepID=UPI0012BB6DBB|nr:nucleotide exchange factor GrpE [Fulvivirga aurantia]MTI22142.1 nucleotide exchange factor GrpE [Fulvivirga aurantia]
MKKENIDEKDVQSTEEANTQAAEAGETPANSEDIKDKIEEETEEEATDNEEMSEEESEISRLQDELSESKDKYLRLYSEFENFRRRTSKEKLDMVQTANAELMADLIPILDDFERAMKTLGEKDADLKAAKDGVQLIQNKFSKALERKGLTPMDSKEGMDFDPEIHEAITQIPAPKPKLKGKVVDVIEKGYLLKDKVIRYAKVVIGS